LRRLRGIKRRIDAGVVVPVDDHRDMAIERWPQIGGEQSVEPLVAPDTASIAITPLQ
jgi:hypothetical protein